MDDGGDPAGTRTRRRTARRRPSAAVALGDRLGTHATPGVAVRAANVPGSPAAGTPARARLGLGAFPVRRMERTDLARESVVRRRCRALRPGDAHPPHLLLRRRVFPLAGAVTTAQ